MSGTGEQFNYSRISVMIFLMLNFPFHVVLGMDGSNDLVIKHPGVAIPADAEPVSVVTNFVEYPLQWTHECYAGSQWETVKHAGLAGRDGQSARLAWCGRHRSGGFHDEQKRF